MRLNNSRLWKERLSSENFPNFKDFVEFLNNQRQLLENTTVKALTNRVSNLIVKISKVNHITIKVSGQVTTPV